jgi:hypothetical protein
VIDDYRRPQVRRHIPRAAGGIETHDKDGEVTDILRFQLNEVLFRNARVYNCPQLSAESRQATQYRHQQGFGAILRDCLPHRQEFNGHAVQNGNTFRENDNILVLNFKFSETSCFAYLRHRLFCSFHLCYSQRRRQEYPFCSSASREKLSNKPSMFSFNKNNLLDSHEFLVLTMQTKQPVKRFPPLL